MINIDDSDDPFYRYKMPQIEITHNLKQRRTLIQNIVAVGKALGRDPKMIGKYLAKSLSTQVKYKRSVLEINGLKEQNELQDILQIFINKWVLCQKCQNPETDLDKNEMNCKACGYSLRF